MPLSPIVKALSELARHLVAGASRSPAELAQVSFHRRLSGANVEVSIRGLPLETAQALAAEAGAVEGVEVSSLGDVVTIVGPYGGLTDIATPPVKRHGRRASVEFVSAYPSAPLGAGDAQLAIIGDAIAAMLERDGWDVTREYFVNDAGQQIGTLTRAAYSVYYAAVRGDGVAGGTVDEATPDYIRHIVARLIETHGNRLIEIEEADWFPIVRETALALILAGVRDDLASLGVVVDHYQSELGLRRSGAVEKAMAAVGEEALAAKGDAAPVFRAANNEWTYFAADVAYHLDRVERGNQRVVDVLRADHGRYSRQLQKTFADLTPEGGELALRLVETSASNADAGRTEQVRLSDVKEGRDPNALRFWMLSRDAGVDPVSALASESASDEISALHAQLRSVLERLELGRPLGNGALGALALWPLHRSLAIALHEPERIGRYLRRLVEALEGGDCDHPGGPGDEDLAKAARDVIRDACAHIGIATEG